MTLKDIIQEIRKLSTADQYRLKEFFVNSLASYSASEPVFKEADAWRAFMTYAKEKGLEHYRLKSDGKERVRGVYHIQNVNSYHSRLKGWINRFYGVATKYLGHYLSWFQFFDQIRHRNDDITVNKMIVESSLFSTCVTYDKLRLS